MSFYWRLIKEKCVSHVQIDRGITFLPPALLPLTSLMQLQSTAPPAHTFQQGSGHADHKLTWAPPTVPCSRNRHMSPGKCGAERTG